MIRRPRPHRQSSRRRRAARFEPLEHRLLLAGLPHGAYPDDTAELLLGRVAVSVVLMESNGTIDANLENWTTAAKSAVKSTVERGLAWWVEALAQKTSVHSLEFVPDWTHFDTPVDTGYEPISRRSNDFELWIEDFFTKVGVASFNDFSTDIRTFNHNQRVAHDTDWAFTLFVVNDTNDSDKMFPPNGSFRQAFSFAGGRFVVMPASRPDSTVAHELGHIFWAKDEYPNSSSYFDRRGYYNTQNLNASDNRPAGAPAQVNSLLHSGTLLQNAFTNRTSSPSSLAMVGWQDTDGDGVFDVLDVPLALEGSGYLDPATSEYRFIGTASAARLPNVNSEGLRNDVTLNRIHRVEYRIDGGAWRAASGTFGKAVEALNLAIPVSATDQVIEIRAVTADKQIVTTSPVFQGSLTTPDSVVEPGISGFAWHDANGNGKWEPGEALLPGWTIQLVDNLGNPVDLKDGVEPDDHAPFTQVGTINPQVKLTAVGLGVLGNHVAVGNYGSASTGSQVFIHRSSATESWTADWTTDSRQLRMDFTSPVSTVSIDAVSRDRDSWGRLEIYDANNKLLGRYTTNRIQAGKFETMSLGTATSEIAYAIASGHMLGSIRLDNLVFGPETSAVTNAQGAYAIPHLVTGTYTVTATAPVGWTPTAPASAFNVIHFTAGNAVAHVDFGGVPSSTLAPWQNPVNRLDVNADTHITPLDALVIINKLNASGAQQLPNPPSGDDVPPPFYDTNGDGHLSPIDALLVINYLNENSGGEGELPGRSFLSAARLPVDGAATAAATATATATASLPWIGVPVFGSAAEGEQTAGLPSHAVAYAATDRGPAARFDPLSVGTPPADLHAARDLAILELTEFEDLLVAPTETFAA